MENECLDFTSTDFLGLAVHPHVKKMGMKALLDWGTLAPSSWQGEIEDRLADLLGKETSLLFPSSHQVIAQTIRALDGPFFIDSRCNPELIEEMHTLGIDFFLYHPEVLPSLLENWKGKKWVLTESVFQQDGQVANLKELGEIAKTYDAKLFVDDSFGFSIFGKKGMGLAAHRKEVDIIFGKSSLGTYLALSHPLKKVLNQKASLLTQAATLSAPLLGAINGALELIPDMELEREKLQRLSESPSPILTSPCRAENLHPKIIATPFPSHIRFIITVLHSEEEVSFLKGTLQNLSFHGIDVHQEAKN